MARTSAVTPEQFANFGDLLKFLRHRAGLTQRELSTAVGYSESQISRLEQNHRAPEEASLAARFVPALNLETEPAWVARLLELGAVSRVTVGLDELEPTAPKPRHNLPLPLTTFIGREKEIEEIKQLLIPVTTMVRLGEASIRPRLVTLTGPGGTGKTRLALQAATELLTAFPAGVWWVELAPVSDPARVPQAVAAALGLPEEEARPWLETLAAHFASRTTLLILDNCEHVVTASAQLAEALLQTCPNLCLLATSREMLGVAGERALYVPSLSMPQPQAQASAETAIQSEAVRLFVARAAAVLPSGFELTDDNAATVVQICQRLDGIPLAIELAAARLRMLPVEQILTRLGDRFRLLTGGSRTALPRHQTLQALIDWSYDLLTASEQMLLRRLAAFAGGWTLEAAEAVGAGGEVTATDVFDLLGRLIDKSLVVVEEQGVAARYRMLETIRQYALTKLAASGEADEVRQRHADYYLTLAETRLPPTDYAPIPAWLERLELEHDNLRAALTWSQSAAGSTELALRLAGGLAWFWMSRGYWKEARSWLEGALAAPDSAQYPAAQARVLGNLGHMMALQGDYAGGQIHFAHSLRLWQELGDLAASAWVLERLGWLAREHNDAATARQQLAAGLALSRELGDKAGLAWKLITLGEALVMQGELDPGAEQIESGLALFQELRHSQGLAWALNHLGHVAQERGQFQQAAQLHADSLAHFQELGSRHLGIAWAHESLGETWLALGDPARAATHLTDGLLLFRELGDRAGMAWCLAGLASAAVEDQPEQAVWVWGAAEALRVAIGAREAPAAHAPHQQRLAAARRQLGAAAFKEAWAQGQAAPLEQAIAQALQLYQ